MASIVEFAPKALRHDLAWTPNDALARAAGIYAARVAKLYERPHAAYLEGCGARRHLIHIAVMRGGVEQARPNAEALASWSLKRAAGAALPDAPAGLIEALRRISGDLQWNEYGVLLQLLAEPMAAKVLRHAEVIDARLIVVLDALPAPLRRARIVAQLPGWYEADLVKRAVAIAAARRDRPIAPARIAEQLERARSPQNLYAALLDATLSQETAGQALPAVDWLRPVVTAPDLRRTGLKFRNCLEGYTGRIGRGTYAAYEVLGDEPACLGLYRSGGHWVIEQLYGVDNCPVTPELAARVMAFCQAHGARTVAQPDPILVRLADLVEAA
jgi:hypothetical protein